MFALFREISFRHWTRSPLRSALVVLGIALGVALYVATEVASTSMLAAFGEFVARIAGRADLTVESTGIGVPSELVGDIAEVPGVAHSAATLELTAQAPELGESLLVLGVDLLGDLHFLPFQVREGEERVVEDPLAFVNDPTAILLSSHFAKRHGLKQDGRIQLLTSEGPKDFHVRGVLEDTGPAASFGGQVAVMFIDAAQVAFARGTYADRIDISLNKDADPRAVKKGVLDLVGKGFTVEEPERTGTKLRELVHPLRSGLGMAGLLALLVGGFLVYNAVGVAVAQRRREIGLLRAFGVTRRAAAALFAGEAALLAVPGIAVGLVLGKVLSRYSTAQTLDALSRLYLAVPDVEPRLTPLLAAQGALAGLVTAVFAAWWPARQGASIDPAIVLRGSASVEPRRVPYRPLLGAGLVCMSAAWLPFLELNRWGRAAAVVLTIFGAALATPALIVALRRLLAPVADWIFGLPGRLGLDYVERSLGRSTVNVLALMVAVSMSVSVGGWLASLEFSILKWSEQMGVAELSITQGSPLLDRRHVPFAGAAADRIATVPGVAHVQRFRIIDQQIGASKIKLVATDTETFRRESAKREKGWTLLSGAPLEAGELEKSRKMLLSENAASLLGLKVGDKVELAAPSGPVVFEVRAVIVDYTSELGAAFIDRSHFLEGWSDDSVDGIFVYLKEGQSPDATGDAIRRELGGGRGIFVTKTAALRDQLVDSLRKTFSYSRSVEIVTLLIALMGVIGTMAATVIDRTREIGMMRAIGATAKQVAASIVSEAGFLGLCAAVAGVVVGIVGCHLFLNTLLTRDTGWHLEFVFPWAATARIGGLVVLTSAVAGGLPAYRAARTDVPSSVVCE